jgi:hypothetical protein
MVCTSTSVFYYGVAGRQRVSAGTLLARIRAINQGTAAERDDVPVTAEALAEQIAYYRRRAGEHDVTPYGDLDPRTARLATDSSQATSDQAGPGREPNARATSSGP